MEISTLTTTADCAGWIFVTSFEQINRRDIDVLWDGMEPVAYRVIKESDQ